MKLFVSVSWIGLAAAADLKVFQVQYYSDDNCKTKYTGYKQGVGGLTVFPIDTCTVLWENNGVVTYGKYECFHDTAGHPADEHSSVAPTKTYSDASCTAFVTTYGFNVGVGRCSIAGSDVWMKAAAGWPGPGKIWAVDKRCGAVMSCSVDTTATWDKKYYDCTNVGSTANKTTTTTAMTTTTTSRTPTSPTTVDLKVFQVQYYSDDNCKTKNTGYKEGVGGLTVFPIDTCTVLDEYRGVVRYTKFECFHDTAGHPEDEHATLAPIKMYSDAKCTAGATTIGGGNKGIGRCSTAGPSGVWMKAVADWPGPGKMWAVDKRCGAVMRCSMNATATTWDKKYYDCTTIKGVKSMANKTTTAQPDAVKNTNASKLAPLASKASMAHPEGATSFATVMTPWFLLVAGNSL